MRAAGSHSTDRQWALAAALVCEVAIFALVAPQFFSVGNLFELTRFSAELGLLAVALTPVLVTGGIDLSVGSLLGLSAVMFGVAHRDWQMAVPAAALVALSVGCAGGALNAFLIAALDLPPLIVTLASFSLFRGIAEGLTGGAINYTAFPDRFLFLGQGYFAGSIPVQLPIFAAIVIGYGVLLHRSIIGRAWYAIGFAPAGARYAGIPVRRRTSDKSDRTRAPAMKSRRSPPSSSAVPPFSAAAVRSGAPCSACLRSRCCRTACISPRCHRSSPASSPACCCWRRSRSTAASGAGAPTTIYRRRLL